jgi:hypothetical protein
MNSRLPLRVGKALPTIFLTLRPNHKLVGCFPYWDDVEYGSEDVPIEQFNLMATRTDSHFFTMDVAQRSDGSWLIVELGDGQVAGLPENAAIPAFYESLIAALSDGR